MNNWINCILDVHELTSYIDGLQKGAEPLTAGTVSEKIRRMRLCIEYIDYLHNENEMTLRCSRVLQKLSKWRGSLRKEIQKRKTEMRTRSKSQVGSATSPEAFMSSTRILQDIIHTFENSENVSPQEHKLILLLISFTYKNAQRLGWCNTWRLRSLKNEKKQKMEIF